MYMSSQDQEQERVVSDPCQRCDIIQALQHSILTLLLLLRINFMLL